MIQTMMNAMIDETRTRSPKGSTVSRVLDILDAVADSEHPLSPTEIATQLSIPKASVHRLCTALEERGYVKTRLNGRGLQSGHRLNRLALSVLSSAPMQAQRQAILSTLSREIGETCNIAVPDGAEMIYFDRACTHWPMQVNLEIGSRSPMYATAAGKMYLSSLSDARRDKLIRNTPMERLTRNTLQSHSALKEELIATRERGYSLNNEEYIEGVVAMAMPIRNHQGRLYATLSFHAPCMRLPISAVSGFLPQLRAASEQLSALLDD